MAEDINWTDMEAEYVRTNISHRALAAKYGLSDTTVSRYASKHNWSSKRQQHASNVGAKLLAADSKRKVDRAARIRETADKLLGRIERLLEEQENLAPKDFRSLSGSLKDLADLSGVKSELDVQEQKARIEKLRREAQKDEDQRSRTVTVVFEAGEDSWNE